MQFKVIFALIFATLAAAATLPNSNPSNANTGNNGPANGNTNTGITNTGNTNTGNTNTVNPPFPATAGGAPPTIDGSKCTSGHLLCCKSDGLPTDPSVAAQLPSGISTDSFSGYAGFDCSTLPDGSQPNTCTYKPLCCTDIVNSIGCNPVTLGL